MGGLLPLALAAAVVKGMRMLQELLKGGANANAANPVRRGLPASQLMGLHIPHIRGYRQWRHCMSLDVIGGIRHFV